MHSQKESHSPKDCLTSCLMIFNIESNIFHHAASCHEEAHDATKEPAMFAVEIGSDGGRMEV